MLLAEKVVSQFLYSLAAFKQLRARACAVGSQRRARPSRCINTRGGALAPAGGRAPRAMCSAASSAPPSARKAHSLRPPKGEKNGSARWPTKVARATLSGSFNNGNFRLRSARVCPTPAKRSIDGDHDGPRTGERRGNCAPTTRPDFGHAFGRAPTIFAPTLQLACSLARSLVGRLPGCWRLALLLLLLLSLDHRC